MGFRVWDLDLTKTYLLGVPYHDFLRCVLKSLGNLGYVMLSVMFLGPRGVVRAIVVKCLDVFRALI